MTDDRTTQEINTCCSHVAAIFHELTGEPISKSYATLTRAIIQAIATRSEPNETHAP